MGNKSCFRNEKLIYNNSSTFEGIISTGDADSSAGDSTKKGLPFIYSEDFVLPKYGTLECDFIYLVNPPLKEEETSEEKQDLIKNLLLGIEGETEKQIAAFVAFSEYLVLSSEQLCSFIDLIDDPKWKAECYISGIGRIYDTREYDFIK
mmetsp:Transcript_24544/g.24399  ORF Transcript_24544/g.24399 Transcript_24544/m.24399 type:complete len:149 (-) Transcript_24544:351-797(-)